MCAVIRITELSLYRFFEVITQLLIHYSRSCLFWNVANSNLYILLYYRLSTTESIWQRSLNKSFHHVCRGFCYYCYTINRQNLFQFSLHHLQFLPLLRNDPLRNRMRMQAHPYHHFALPGFAFGVTLGFETAPMTRPSLQIDELVDLTVQYQIRRTVLIVNEFVKA